MECPYFDQQSQCSCQQRPDSHTLGPGDIEEYCRRSRHVLCPVFNVAESVDLSDIFADDQTL